MRKSLELRFLEIGIDPDFAKRADSHQTLAGQDIVAWIDIAARDDAVDFRNDGAIAKI